jgi:acyl-CoA thioester hydrolase
MSKPGSRWSAESQLQVQFFDLDPMEIVWHGHYVKYPEIVRCALLDSIDYNYVQMKESGYAWPVIDLHVRYAAPEWENRLKIDYAILDAASGRRLTRASTTQVAVGIATAEMCFVSAPVLFQKLGVQSS